MSGRKARKVISLRVLKRSPCFAAVSILTLLPVAGWSYPLTDLPAPVLHSYIREIVAAAAGAFGLAFLILLRRSRGRLKRLEAQRNELALAVMLRTREIRREKETVVRQKQQIEELLEKAQQNNRAKDEFLANISHEIRTPLHGVIGMTELTLHTKLTGEQREYLELADASAKSLLALVNDVLDFSKIEAGGLKLEHAPFSVRECVQDATLGFAVAAKQKGVEYHVNVAAEVPEVIEGDALRLRQVLVNLVSNAVKFTENGSVVLDVSLDSASDSLLFKVRDTGIGIAKENLEAIFEPFRQADGSTTRKYGGTGLGLSISVRLAKRMGGELTLESEEGVGSTFTLRLPVQRSGESELSADEPPLKLVARKAS